MCCWLGSPFPGLADFSFLAVPSAPRRIMEVRWMTTMTWNLSKTRRTMQTYRELMARRTTTTERC